MAGKDGNEPRPTREQIRAAAAFERVKVASTQADSRDDYGRLCRRLPALILQAGLCQAVMFLEAKASDGAGGRKKAFAQIADDLAVVTKMAKNRAELGKKVREAPVAEYRRITVEALRSAHYLKRYAEALSLEADGDLK